MEGWRNGLAAQKRKRLRRILDSTILRLKNNALEKEEKTTTGGRCQPGSVAEGTREKIKYKEKVQFGNKAMR